MAVVMGDVDMVRALGLAGIDSAFFGTPHAPARFSRHVRAVLRPIAGWEREPERRDELLQALLRFARLQPEPPVLYPQTDATLLLASRHRDALAPAFRLSLADAGLIEQLVDKGRFQTLAESHGLPVPAAERFHPLPAQPPPQLSLSFPVIVKPAVRVGSWLTLAKAIRVDGSGEWHERWGELARLDTEVLVQQLIPGPECAIESYHAYIDQRGAVAGEFTGRKIRTYPAQYGNSTSVEITDAEDVARLGRETLRKLGLRGVAKVDFKRDEQGRLYLLEVNPRFNLWHHPAAVGGVNLPALVHADLTGSPRPNGHRAVRAVAWCQPLVDLRAAYESGMSPLEWLLWARRCGAVSGLAADDPLPFVRGMLWGGTSRRVRRLGATARRPGAARA
jgi:predicted ATP-grasp superfamily ATP-dependent carboligase